MSTLLLGLSCQILDCKLLGVGTCFYVRPSVKCYIYTDGSTQIFNIIIVGSGESDCVSGYAVNFNFADHLHLWFRNARTWRESFAFEWATGCEFMPIVDDEGLAMCNCFGSVL